MDVYSELTINKMCKDGFLNYLKLMLEDKDIPVKNKVSLIYLKVVDYEKAANEEILAAATKRRELYNGK